MAVSLRAARRTGARAGDLVSIHGAGPIGLGAVLALRAAGVAVLVSDPSPARRAAAAALGAEHVVDPSETNVAAAGRDLTGGLGTAGAIDAAGAEAAFQSALRGLRPDGTLVVVGHHHQPIQLRSWSLIGSETRVTGSVIYDGADIAAVIAGMVAGHYPLDGWVTTITLDRVVEDGLFPLREQRAGKVLVDLRQ
jgi:(R,R)-butanediol dehydrogenase/meso-butanediol dehydrogenase/diacetyl reductase